MQSQPLEAQSSCRGRLFTLSLEGLRRVVCVRMNLRNALSASRMGLRGGPLLSLAVSVIPSGATRFSPSRCILARRVAQSRDLLVSCLLVAGRWSLIPLSQMPQEQRPLSITGEA